MKEEKVMAEAALFIGWGEPARGREKGALEVFNESMQYWGRLQKEGKIERFDVAALAPHGGDLGGFVLLRGTAQQIDSVRRDEEFERLIARVRLNVDGIGLADVFVDEKLAQVMAQYQEEIGKLG
jgi:hypothetical protein